MKRNLLAIAIPALLIAGAANASIEVWNKDGNKLNVYGRVKALNYVGNQNNLIDGEGDKTTGRVGFTGETQVTDLLSGYGRFEWETRTGKDANNETRYAFAGLNFGPYGSFDYGRNDGVLKSITTYTDVLPEFGGNAADNSIYALSSRNDGVATYRNSDFYGLVDGLSFALQYADKDNDPNPLRNEKNQEGYGLNVQYDILDTGLTIGAGFAHGSSTIKGETGKTWNVGLKYDAYNLYLAAIYTHSKDVTGHAVITPSFVGIHADKVEGYEFVAQYGIDFEIGRLTPSVAYIQHKNKDLDAFYSKYVEVGLQYDFNKNLTALIDYKINLLDNKDVQRVGSYKGTDIHAGTKDTVALGLIYQF